MSLILKNAVKQVDEKSKSYFVDKLKEYDYLIDEKEKKLSELESELLKRKNGLNDNSLSESGPKYDFDTSIIDLLTETNYLDKNIFELNDPTVVVLVPNDKVNYDYIDKNIKTKVSDGIYKGIKILYRNKVYDFSLNEGNV